MPNRRQPSSAAVLRSCSFPTGPPPRSSGKGAGLFCFCAGSTGTQVLSLVMSAVAHYDVRRLTDTSTRPPLTSMHLGVASSDIGPGFPSMVALRDHSENLR